MSDDLLALARRAYGPEATMSVHGKVARVMHGPAVMLHVYGERPAEALEAALLVLAGEGHISYAVHAPGLKQKLRKLAAEACGPPAWVEKLAAEYEERAALRDELAREARAADRHQNAADFAMWASHYRNLAAELRERAKGNGE